MFLIRMVCTFVYLFSSVSWANSIKLPLSQSTEKPVFMAVYSKHLGRAFVGVVRDEMASFADCVVPRNLDHPVHVADFELCQEIPGSFYPTTPDMINRIDSAVPDLLKKNYEQSQKDYNRLHPGSQAAYLLPTLMATIAMGAVTTGAVVATVDQFKSGAYFRGAALGAGGVVVGLMAATSAAGFTWAAFSDPYSGPVLPLEDSVSLTVQRMYEKGELKSLSDIDPQEFETLFNTIETSILEAVQNARST